MTLTPKQLIAWSLAAALVGGVPGFPATQALAGVVAGGGRDLVLSMGGQARGAGVAKKTAAAAELDTRFALPGATPGTAAERPQAASAADVATAIANNEAVQMLTSQEAGVSDATRVSAMTKIYDDQRVAPTGETLDVVDYRSVPVFLLAASSNRASVFQPSVVSRWRDATASSIGGSLSDPGKAAVIGGVVGLVSMLVALPIFGLKSLLIPAAIGLLIGGATGFSDRSDSRAASFLQSASLVGGVAGLAAGLITFHSSHVFMSLLNLSMSVGTGVAVPPLIAKLRQAVGSPDSVVGNVIVSALAGMIAGLTLPILLTADAFRRQSARGAFARFRDRSGYTIGSWAVGPEDQSAQTAPNLVAQLRGELPLLKQLVGRWLRGARSFDRFKDGSASAIESGDPATEPQAVKPEAAKPTPSPMTELRGEARRLREGFDQAIAELKEIFREFFPGRKQGGGAAQNGATARSGETAERGVDAAKDNSASAIQSAQRLKQVAGRVSHAVVDFLLGVMSNPFKLFAAAAVLAVALVLVVTHFGVMVPFITACVILLLFLPLIGK